MAPASAASASVIIRQVAVERILALRHAVLRAELPFEAAGFDGDDAGGTIHLAACHGQAVVGCASFMRRAFDGEDAYQLRGMATAPQWRRQGLGHRLLTGAEQLLQDEPVRLRWCNARATAIPFYLQEGWSVVSEVFDIPGAGPHRRMIRRL